MSNGKVMVIGLGEVGGYALEFLARTPGIAEIIAADVREEFGLRKVHLAAVGASYQGFTPNIDFIKMDLNDIDSTAEVISRTEPNVILNATTLQSWFVPLLLPAEISHKLGPQGNDVSMHLTLTYKLMKAVHEAKIRCHVINASYADVTNSILEKVGLAPTIGLGNIDLVVQCLRHFVCRKLDVCISDVTVLMVAHHAVIFDIGNKGRVGEMPYYLKVLVCGDDVTDQFDFKKTAPQLYGYVPLGAGSSPQVSSSGVKNILALLNDTKQLTHSPGPNGLPGGYPVRLSARGAQVAVPKEVSLKEAIRINEEGARYDGIERIEDDGTVVYTDEAVKGLADLLGMPQKKFNVKESEQRAKAFLAAYNRLVERCGTRST